MERSLDILREKAFAYAGEAFEEHREQIFGAMYAVDLCSDRVRQSGLLALDILAELWAEEKGLAIQDPISQGQYDEETLACSLKGRDVPLMELLIFAIFKTVDPSDPDILAEQILAQAKKDGCSGDEWFVVYIYLIGALDIYAARSPRSVFLRHRVMIPEKYLGDYDRYVEGHLSPWDKRERAFRQERADNGFAREISVKTAFGKRFGEMESERLRSLLKEVDVQTLAEGTAFAEEGIRNRFLAHMEERQREAVKEAWSYSRAYCYHLVDSLDAMDRMLILAGLAG